MPPLIELTPRDLRQIEALAGLGYTQAEIANALGFSERTFRDKKATDDALSAAWTRGKLKPKAVVGAVALRNAIDGDQRAVEFYLGAYCGISPRHAETAKQENPEDPMELADPHMELLRRYEEIAARQAEGAMPEPGDLGEPVAREHSPEDVDPHRQERQYDDQTETAEGAAARGEEGAVA